MTEKESGAKELPVPKITAGFGILIDDQGNMFIERDPQVFTIPVERQSTLVEVRRYCSEVLMDLNAQTAAEYTFLKLKSEEIKASSDAPTA